jgi:DNA-binding NtrC family response regulator
LTAARTAYEQALATDLPVLIVGEPGTGRRDLARALHAGSQRRGRRLTWFTCANGQDQTDADLFGSEANAVPGIVRRRIGWLELARSSTLVLDDLGELDLATQRLLCAAIESGGFRRVSGVDTLPLDVRLVGLTRFDPTRSAERFDPRLLDGLGAVRIELPSLREHLEDLPLIIRNMLDALTIGKLPAELDPAAYRVLLAHDWPGNTREVRSVLQQALLSAGGSTILAAHLPPLQLQQPRTARIGFASEREWILDGLRRNRFRRAETARFLGVSRKTLYNKMVALGLMVSVAGRQA